MIFINSLPYFNQLIVSTRLLIVSFSIVSLKGDRIMSITVSCEKMVYEDALTILSYASPYDVTLQVEKTSKSKATTPNGLTSNGHIYMPRRYANGFTGSSDPSNHRILHPVFRSHSVGELTTRLNGSGGVGGSGDDDKPPSSLEEKSFGSIKSINSLLRKIKTSLYRSTASIKSNQSGKMTTDYCSTNGLNDGSEGGYHHSCYSLDASGLMNGQISSSSSYILPSPTNNTKSEEIAINMSPKEPMVTSIKHLSSSIPIDEMVNNLPQDKNEPINEKPVFDEPMIMIPHGSPTDIDQPRKLNQGKRKAPAPPSPSSSVCSIEMKPGSIDGRDVIDDGTLLIVKNHRNEQRSTTPGGSKVETHADIHQEQGSSEDFNMLQGQSLSDISEIKSPAIDASMSLAIESLTSDESITEPLAVNLVKEIKTDGRTGRAPSPANGKSRSCSMSDLTLVKNKKPTSTIILERAVSLDLRDQLGPEENKILQQGTLVEDNEGLLRWSESKPPVNGPDSLSTTYSSEMLGSNSKTNDFTDDSLTITIDESSDKLIAPKPAERTSLKRNSLSNSTDSRLRSSSKFETTDMTISEEDNIVAPPDGFGPDHQHHQSQIASSSKPSVEDFKLKSYLNTNSQMEPEDLPYDDNVTQKVQPNKLTTINGSAKSVHHDKSTINTHEMKPPTPEKPSTLSSKYEKLSPSQERLDSTIFAVPTKIETSPLFKDENKSPVNGISNPKEGDKSDNNDNIHGQTDSSSSSSTNNNKYPDEPEVIEISPNELSQVMMSHEEFLAHKSKLSYSKLPKTNCNTNLINKSGLNGIGGIGHSIGSKVPPSTIIQIGETGDNDFESWSYLSDVESNLPSLSNEARYKTTCDMGQLNDGSADEMLIKKV